MSMRFLEIHQRQEGKGVWYETFVGLIHSWEPLEMFEMEKEHVNELLAIKDHPPLTASQAQHLIKSRNYQDADYRVIDQCSLSQAEEARLLKRLIAQKRDH